MQDVEATKEIADLNIDRLHKTLKDLESERQKAELANKTKQLFLASVTHELRTPLTAIHGFADLFEQDNLTNDQKSSIEIIKEASSSLLNIVNDLLNYSKISDGKLTFYNEPFDLFPAVNNVFELLKQKAQEKSIAFILDFSIDRNLKVFGDKFRLKQILTNLISNAIKFTEKGEVKISVSSSMGSNILFRVEDTGVGIKSDKLNNVFESFVQAEDSTSHEYGGTGLGLSIVKELIEMQGGEITVKSEINKGSVFSFQLSLPIVEVAVGIVEDESQQDFDLSSVTVLAVEDNHLNQMLIQKLLGKKLKHLDIAGDGESAVELTLSKKYDVILMDLQLPKMNGLDALVEIRKGKLNTMTPVAVITANVWEEQLDLIKKSGVKTIIQKPFIKKDLYFQIYSLFTERTEDLINLNYLNQISGGDHFFIEEVLSTYQNNILVDFEKLNTAVDSKNMEESRTIAHKMKSSFKMLDITEACNICRDIEDAKVAGASVDLIKVLKSVIDRSLMESAQWIEKHKN